MDNQDFARLDTLSEKAFNQTISANELKEYLQFLDEWDVIDPSLFDDHNFIE
jgi:hypothetical protein